MVENLPLTGHQKADEPSDNVELTLVNSANWDGDTVASTIGRTLAFCANASVHLLRLNVEGDAGFAHWRSVGFSTKFKKQFCRCTTVLLLSETSMLVSLDKRTVVWHKDIRESLTSANATMSVSVGDVAVKMAMVPKSGGKTMTATLTKVIALTTHGIVYRFTLSEQRGLSLELLSKDRVQSPITASEINCSREDSSVQILYGTEDGQVSLISIDANGVISRRLVGEFAGKNSKVSGVMTIGAEVYLSTTKDGNVMLSPNGPSKTFTKMPSSYDDDTNQKIDVEETKSAAKKAAPKTLQSCRLLKIPGVSQKVIISGKDGHLYISDVDQLQQTASDSTSFGSKLKLVSDNGHNMPVLQLLSIGNVTDDEDLFVSLGYDRTIVAWQVAGDNFIDQIARVPCLGQIIDANMVQFATPDEVIIVQNRPSCQKLLCLELPSTTDNDDDGDSWDDNNKGQQKVLLTNDLTSTKILDRSATITAFAIGADDHTLLALIYDATRLVIYDTLQKDIVKKYKPSGQVPSKILAVTLTRSSVELLVATSAMPSKARSAQPQLKKSTLELQVLCLQTGKLLRKWSTQDDSETFTVGKLTKNALSYCKEKSASWTTVILPRSPLSSEAPMTVDLFDTELLTSLQSNVILVYSAHYKKLALASCETGQIVQESAPIAQHLRPLLVVGLEERQQVAMVQRDAQTQILLIDLASLQIVKRVSVADVLGPAASSSSVFSGKVTCMEACGTKLVIASEDKCLRVVDVSSLDRAKDQPLLLPHQSQKNASSKPQQQQTESKRQKTTDKATTLASNVYEKTMFSIVRSRVFYQQKSADTQVVIQKMSSAVEDSDSIDLKLLIYHLNDAARNRQDALSVIEAELASCVFISKFDYFQKLIVLNLWLASLSTTVQRDSQAVTVDKVKELVQMHMPNVIQAEQDGQRLLSQTYRQALEETCNMTSTQQLQTNSNVYLHLAQASLILSKPQDSAVVIANYIRKSCFVEALVLAKLWNLKQAFIEALSALIEQLKRENKQLQVNKVSKALSMVTDETQKDGTEALQSKVHPPITDSTN